MGINSSKIFAKKTALLVRFVEIDKWPRIRGPGPFLPHITYFSRKWIFGPSGSRRGAARWGWAGVWWLAGCPLSSPSRRGLPSICGGLLSWSGPAVFGLSPAFRSPAEWGGIVVYRYSFCGFVERRSIFKANDISSCRKGKSKEAVRRSRQLPEATEDSARHAESSKDEKVVIQPNLIHKISHSTLYQLLYFL